MEIVSLNEIPMEPRLPPMHIGEVESQNLVPDSEQTAIGILHFSKGARNRLHTHLVDQVLVVTAGEGIVATDKEERTVTVGDVIVFPAGEKHWHGATKDSGFSHLFVLRKDFTEEHRAEIVDDQG
ncbi:cupin domain-containing protein [Chloroflexota bacterium]